MPVMLNLWACGCSCWSSPCLTCGSVVACGVVDTESPLSAAGAFGYDSLTVWCGQLFLISSLNTPEGCEFVSSRMWNKWKTQTSQIKMEVVITQAKKTGKQKPMKLIKKTNNKKYMETKNNHTCKNMKPLFDLIPRCSRVITKLI